ncbi:MAG: AMP-binding protein [Pseudomonadales bacterium]|nr:AMP-binding protein [Pseudomonadales bacterium]MCP5173191.1 AMP-binding protein [Pseudomonadales bacterium]
MELSHWVGDKSQDLLELTLVDLLRKAATEVPDRIALVDAVADPSARRRWSYQQLLADTEKLARGLLYYFSPGDRIAVYAANSAEWVLLQHAVSFAGMVLVPVNPAYSEGELETVLRNSGASGVFFDRQNRGRNLEEMVKNTAAKLDSVKSIFPLSELAVIGEQSTGSVVLPDVGCEDILLIQYTSGTTGVPKGACLHHKGVINSSRSVAQRAGFPEGGIWINAMPMFHIGGSSVTRIGALNYQGTYVVVPGFEPGLMLEVIASEKGNTTLIVPTMILALLDHPDFEHFDVSSMVSILTGAADVPPALASRAKEAFGCELSILFGQTEANGVFSQSSVDDNFEDQTGTLGKPLPHVEVCIADPDTGEILRLGERGEIWVRGYLTMTGYFGMEEATRNTIRDDGWLRTGDMGIMDDRGYLKIAGRIKDMIIRGGMNIYPREIEDLLFSHPDVNQIAVVGLPDEQWGEIVAAVVLPKDANNPPSPDDLFKLCREKLAPHKSPVIWYFVDDFPLTPSGKIQKFQLVDWIREGKITAHKWVKPGSREAS